MVGLLALLKRLPNAETTSFSSLSTFLHLASRLKREILQPQPVSTTFVDIAPEVLPFSVEIFLSRAVGLSQEETDVWWSVLKDEVWGMEAFSLNKHEQDLFRRHGWPLGLTALSLYPASIFCTNPDCIRNTPLKRELSQSTVVVFTKEGVQPAHEVVTYCPGCKTSYHNNYSVTNGVRTYYEDMPTFIQVAKHHFVEISVVRVWIVQLLQGWYSFSNEAASYDRAMNLDPDMYSCAFWGLSSELRQEHVSDGFVTVSLLDDSHRRGYILQVPHTGEQSRRFRLAMEARNEWVVNNGQPDAVCHACNKCMRAYKMKDGSYRACQAIVIDGISMGRPCCGVFRCLNPLHNNRHRYCQDHDALHNQCAIESCERPGHILQQTMKDGTVKVQRAKTCDDAVHQAFEKRRQERSTGSFLLNPRLQHAQVSQPTNSLSARPQTANQDLEEDTELFIVDPQGNVHIDIQKSAGSIGTTTDGVEPDCPSKKSDLGNVKYKGQFTCRRTHNEETLVRPCGIIFARATMYGAEAVSNVLVIVKKAFSVPGARKPEHIFYDTNCDAHQQAEKDPWFDNIGMCVDVWHFNNKHAITHAYCQANCNPAMYPELMDDLGGWFFNTSVAEQTNAWLGGYHSICREMLPARYDFFLDEMIRLRNVAMLRHLEQLGHYPHEIV